MHFDYKINSAGGGDSSNAIPTMGALTSVDVLSNRIPVEQANELIALALTQIEALTLIGTLTQIEALTQIPD